MRRVMQYIVVSVCVLGSVAGCRDPERARLEFEHAETLYARQALPEALAAYRAALAADDELDAARIGVARTLFYQRQLAAAEAPLQDVLSNEPCNLHARIWLVRVQMLLPDREADGLATADAGLACGPSAELWRAKGKLHERRGEYAAALAAYRAAIDAAPESARAAVDMAALFQRMGQGARSAEMRTLARRLANEDPAALRQLETLERSLARGPTR